MRKNVILVVVAIVVIAVVAYLIWHGNSSNDLVSQATPTPNPTQVPTPTPPPTSQDYKAPFKTFSAKEVSIEYPSTWVIVTPSADNNTGVASILSPSTKAKVDAGKSNGYDYDFNVQYASDLFSMLGNSYTKGQNIIVGSKSGYWVVIQGNDINDGVVVQNNGYYVFSFPPQMEKSLQEEILKHITFTK
ncbi:MAG: hypothetical protein KW788_00605 [Candidatus Doudnabacteria bacterium]|nr:hypothetical protein [Candidatus Doudnabacteria bacterium]